jgi:hypothetical protein
MPSSALAMCVFLATLKQRRGSIGALRLVGPRLHQEAHRENPRLLRIVEEGSRGRDDRGPPVSAIVRLTPCLRSIPGSRPLDEGLHEGRVHLRVEAGEPLFGTPKDPLTIPIW